MRVERLLALLALAAPPGCFGLRDSPGEDGAVAVDARASDGSGGGDAANGLDALASDGGGACNGVGAPCAGGGGDCAAGQACYVGGEQGVCSTDRPICGGFAGAECPEEAPNCLYLTGTDYGLCATDDERACICAGGPGAVICN